MAENFMANISENFDIQKLTEELVQQYQAKGFNVRVLKMKNGAKITFDKKCGGINMLLGLGQGITANFTIHGKEKDTLSVTYSDGDWAGKIIGLIVGWFMCWIPCITAIIGIFKQLSLPKDINNDIQMLVSEME